MAGKEGSTKRGKEGSTRRSKGRRAAGEAGGFSLGPCTGGFSLGPCTGGFSLEPCTGGFSLGQCATKHMAVEESVIGEEGAFSLRPCATKHMAAEEATKRKDHCEQRAVELISEEPPMMSDVVLRERVKTSLLTFPEVAALDADQLDVAVDRIIKEYKPETASPTTPGMCRLSDDDIGTFFYCNMTEIPTAEDLAPGGVFPAGWIEERRQQLDQEVRPENKKLGRDIEPLLAKIRVDLLTKGYVDVPELYFHETPEVQAALMEEQATREHKEYTAVAGPDDDEWWLEDAVITRCVLKSS